MLFFQRIRIAPRFCFCVHAIVLMIFMPLAVLNLCAQTATQQRVYGSASVTTSTSVLPGYEKDSTTGTLTALAGAPFADKLEGGLVAIDGQGEFLFVLNPVSDSISMYQIDGSNGALTEVPNSPFAAGPTVNPSMAPSHPISLATEVSGKFLYVGYANGDSTTTSALIPFAIDAVNLALVLTPQLSLDFGNGAPVQMVADPKGLRLYVGLGPGGSQPATAAGTTVYSIDGSNGVLTAVGNAGGGSDLGRAIAIDPQGRFFFDGWGQSQGFVDSGVISPVDGTSSATFTQDLGQGVYPLALFVESSGKYLYVQTNTGLLIYSIDQSSGGLTQLNGPLAAFAFGAGTVAADPMGPYVYSLARTGVDVFQIDPQTGNLAEIPGAPFAIGDSAAQGSLGLAISGSPTLNASGPVAQLFPTSADLGPVTIGKASATKIMSLVNTGDQLLAVNGIAISGGNAGDFAQSNTCGPTLAPNANCSISVLFTPSAAGPEQATLQITDNAAASPQSAVLSGTGIATASSVTLSPGSLDFGTVMEGASVAAKTIQVTNSGTRVLHISAVALSGSNPGDFSQSNTCVASPVAVQASCAITVNFTPQAGGQRTASIVLTDDAANSPQSVALSGTAIATTPSVTLMPGSLNFGTIAEGVNAPAKTILLTNSGTRVLHISAGALSGSNPGDFSQSNTCVGNPVAVQGNCSITVNFAPQSEGQRSASILVTDDAVSSPQSIALSGDLASPFQLGAAPAGSTSATVSAGVTANYALQLMPGPGYTGTVSISCSGAPVGAACNVVPGSMIVSNGSAVPFEVMVTTSGNALAILPGGFTPRILNWNGRVEWLIAGWMLGWILLRNRRGHDISCPYMKMGRERRLILQFLCGGVLLGAIAMTVAGCGGSAAPDPPRIVTPAGTTTLTVTARSGSLTPQSIQLTLTVQ